MTTSTYNNVNTFAVSPIIVKPEYNPFNGKLDPYHKSNVITSNQDMTRNERAIGMLDYAIENEIHKANTFVEVAVLINTLYNDTVIFECDGTYLLHHIRANTANLAASPVYSLHDILRMLILEYNSELTIDTGLPKFFNIYKYMRYTASEYDLNDIINFTNIYIKSIPHILREGNKYLIDGQYINKEYLQNALAPHFHIQFNAYISVLQSRLES